MSYQVLARKYRPQKFADVIGQEHVTRTLRNAIEQARTAHGYIFSGHRGIGKTTVARILAMALNCRSAEKPVPEPCGVCVSCVEVRAGNSVDVMEIDAATNRGIDEIRELREAARYRPARDRFKIYILDEAHQITDAAFNALLKTLEEPPGHVVFMLATTQPEDIPQTIRSRCQHFSFRAVRFEQILGQLTELCAKENVEAEEEGLALLAEAGDGSMRDALSLLDQAIASGQGRLSAESIRPLVGAAPSAVLENIMQAVSASSSQEILEITDRLLAEGHNPVHLSRQLVRFLRNSLVAKIAGVDSSLLQTSSDERSRVARVAELFSEEDLARHLQIMLRTHAELGYRQEQRFHLELGLLKLAHAQKLLPIEQLLSGREDEKRISSDRTVSIASEAKRVDSGVARRAVSPFAADSARKGTPRLESGNNPAGVPARALPLSPISPQVVMGSAAPAVARQPEAEADADESEQVRVAVLEAIAASGSGMLAAMLEPATWEIAGNELRIRVAASAALIEMALSHDARSSMIASASAKLGRTLKLQVIPGAASKSDAPRTVLSATNGSSRGRAEQEPVVRRMVEKFGAEIRTVIDYKAKP
ncbi:MAG: DNA polymerase III subunit gamma/tau [Acidobacteria bacterium]|nr:DNA polymerase III subunit gamma/tau [Acidobacteriota bacterium]